MRGLFATLMALVALATARPAAAGWMQASSPRFVVYGDMDPREIEAFATKLERFDQLLRIATGLNAPAAPNPLTVYVMRNVSQVQGQLGRGGRNVAGFYTPVISGAIAVVPEDAGSGARFSIDAQTVLFHEYAHHFMLQYFPFGYPAWYVEGFAEYWSTTQFKDDGGVTTGYPARHRYPALALGTPFPLARMFADDFGAPLTGAEISSFYSWSWLLTHYLSLSPDRKGQLTTYLKAYATGTPPAQAATRAFGDLAVLDRDLDRYRNARRISYVTLNGVDFAKPAISVRPISASGDPLVPTMLRFARGSRDAAMVAAFAADVRRLAPRYPGDPRMLEMLAEGELDAGEHDAATRANDALLALRPADARGLLRRARIAAARLGKSTDADGWRAVRLLVVKANRASPDDPWPLVEYYRTFGAAGLPPTKLAIDGLDRALELAPQVATTRFALGRELMRTGERERARQVLTPLINDPHSAGRRAAARALLAGQPAPEAADAEASTD